MFCIILQAEKYFASQMTSIGVNSKVLYPVYKSNISKFIKLTIRKTITLKKPLA